MCLQERLTVHNAELCDRLAATQHSRTILEREVLTLKRKLLEEKTVNGRLDQLLLSSEREKATLKNQLAQHNSETSHETNLEALNREKVTDAKYWMMSCGIKIFYEMGFTSDFLEVCARGGKSEFRQFRRLYLVLLPHGVYNDGTSLQYTFVPT